MKVTIKPGTAKAGLLGREIHTVHVTVTMSEEEKAAAKAAGLLNHHMFNVPFSDKRDGGASCDVSQIVRGLDVIGKFSNFLDANEFSEHVKAQLVSLKSALEAKMGAGEEKFEL